MSDPFRRPQDLYASIISPIGSFVDKAKVKRALLCLPVFSAFLRSYNLGSYDRKFPSLTSFVLHIFTHAAVLIYFVHAVAVMVGGYLLSTD